MTQTYAPHEYANIFQIHDGRPLWDLSDDIKVHGQHEPIVLFEGKVLDGRRRLAACIRAKVEPKFRHFKGTDEEALAFVVGANLHRRHLGETERAMAAAKIATLKKGANQHTAVAVCSGEGDIPQAKAAEMMDVSVDSLQRAKKVLDHGTPELQKAVAEGTVSISDASSAASEEPAVQRKAVKRVKEKKAKTIRQAILQTKSDADESDEEIKDDEGTLVPAKAKEAFVVAKDFTTVCRDLDGMVRRVSELAKLPGGELINDPKVLPTILQNLKVAKQNLWANRATHVCPFCQGEKDKCSCCKGRGWTTKMHFSQAQPNTA
jgi:ParB-like chromosome segregation protein Spo0J